MAKRKSTRSVNKTTLLVMGEGEHDKAFLSHMKGTLAVKSRLVFRMAALHTISSRIRSKRAVTSIMTRSLF